MANKTEKTEEKLSGNNLLIVLALVTFLVVGVTALVTKFMVASIQLDSKVISKKGTADKNLTTDLDAAPKLVEAYNALDSKAGVVADALPNTADYPSLIVELENIANGAGVRLKTVSPDLTGPAAGEATTAPAASSATDSGNAAPQRYDFTITYDGNYDALVRLLTSLETSARPMRVIGMTSSGSGSSLSGQLDVETYYMDKAELPISKEEVK